MKGNDIIELIKREKLEDADLVFSIIMGDKFTRLVFDKNETFSPFPKEGTLNWFELEFQRGIIKD